MFKKFSLALRKEHGMFRKFSLALFLVAVFSVQAFAVQPQEALSAAVSKGQVAILLVTGPDSQNSEQARATVREAARQIQGCVTVEMDKADASNAALVSRFGLAGAPVPLILMFASNGALAGGIPSAKATPEAIVRMVPSPKKAAVLQELQAGNAVFLVASRKTMSDQATAMENCALACGRVQGKAATVQVDLDDAAEKTFLADLRVSAAAESPVTVVINPQGQLTGSFTGAVDVAALAQAATTKAGGCCPPGSGKSCAPPKK
jgi:hypothetical protein